MCCYLHNLQLAISILNQIHCFQTPLAVKIVELTLRYPGTNDEHFHEIYKLCLAVVCSDIREVHHDHIIKMLELCLEQAVKHKETSQKALAHSTFLQMLSQLPRNLASEGELPASAEVLYKV